MDKKDDYLRYISRLIGIAIETRQEPYMCEVLMPFLRYCCYGINVKPVAVFDDRGYKSKKEPQKLTSSINRLRNLLCADTYAKEKKYSVPDYVFVNDEYVFGSPYKAILLVETKAPKIREKDGVYKYEGLSSYLKNASICDQIRTEIRELGNKPVLFTDGICWEVLWLEDETDDNAKICKVSSSAFKSKEILKPGEEVMAMEREDRYKT